MLTDHPQEKQQRESLAITDESTESVVPDNPISADNSQHKPQPEKIQSQDDAAVSEVSEKAISQKTGNIYTGNRFLRQKWLLLNLLQEWFYRFHQCR